jgi:uncharacterized protein (DUF1501 family)
MPTRRLFLKSSALAMFGVGSVPLWLSRAVYAKEAPAAARKKILITVFQRGAVDGLNVVVPHGDPAYYALRPSIALPRPNGADTAVIDLDGSFGLHPSLRALKPFWDRRQLAIVEAVGSPDPTRSHFDAQDYMESGTPGMKATYDGWLNRALCPEATPSPVRAVSLGEEVARSLRGKNQALAIGNVNDFQVKDQRMAATFESMYGVSTDQVLNTTARETFDAVRLVKSIQSKPYVAANAAAYPNGRFGQSLQQIARIIKADVGLEVAFTDIGGWDTHVNEVAGQPHEGRLAQLLREFGDGLAAFATDMGDRMADITVVTMSEFGRTARENGNRGTDHGHANVMFALGGNVHGGKVYGEWPGLQPEQLYEGRDLNVTTDFRTVLSELVAGQLGNHDLAHVFPGFERTKPAGLLT